MGEEQRLEQIDVIRVYDEKAHILGRNGTRNSYLHYIIHNIDTGTIAYEESFKENNGTVLCEAAQASVIDRGI